MFTKNLKEIRKDNKGYSTAAVIIVLAIIGILTSAVMMASMNNFQMTQTDTKSKTNFYTVENALDQLRAGISEEVTVAAESAYLKAVQEYVKFSTLQDATYKTTFLNKLKSNLLSPVEANSYYISDKEDDFNEVSGMYVKGLASYFDRGMANEYKEGRLIIQNTYGSNNLVVENDSVILKGIELQYTNADGYYSVISTDIVIEIPALQLTKRIYEPEMNAYSIIANKVVFNNTDATKVYGNVYSFSDMEFKNSDVSFEDSEFDDKYIIAGNNFNVDGMSHVNLSNYWLWTDKLTVQGDAVQGSTSATASLSNDVLSSIYANGSFNIVGHNSFIDLNGSYIGYGENGNIIVNGCNNTLDLRDLSLLNLRASSFIKVDADNPSEDIGMGASVATKLDQLVYLVPAECMGVARNPMTASEHTAWDKSIDISVVCNDTGKKLSDYGLTETSYKTIYKESSLGESVCYVFLDFGGDVLSSAKYHKDFVTDNEEMAEYYDVYDNQIKLMTDSYTTQTKGYLFSYKNGENIKPFIPNSGVSSYLELSTVEVNAIEDTFLEMENTFLNVISELRINGGASSKVFAYDSLVNKIAVSEVFNGVKRYEEGGIKAIVANNKNGSALEVGSLSSDPTAAVVVANGDVTVKGDFAGVILCEGTVTIAQGTGAEIRADDILVSSALKLEDETGMSFQKKYMLGGDQTVSDEVISEQYKWVDDVISYRNWSKR